MADIQDQARRHRALGAKEMWLAVHAGAEYRDSLNAIIGGGRDKAAKRDPVRGAIELAKTLGDHTGARRLALKQKAHTALQDLLKQGPPNV